MMNDLHLDIPMDFDFKILEMTRDTATGDIILNIGPIVEMIEFSKLDIEIDSDTLPILLYALYQVHLSRGGKPDFVQEQLLFELQAEIDYGIATVGKSNMIH